ncbi:CMP-N-acetylneuraminate-beta-galactosamide-alpha-2,3-sialyltransferase 1-like, partial [Oscarella lobularis]|uniref:CMP-N-acetylneuraminate-beta-galactosamide- alpha-2,3-sialyltransferase 1-like n=1 Tax=Oscarella lobularis TaxID=121494 RepID=UPI003313A040
MFLVASRIDRKFSDEQFHQTSEETFKVISSEDIFSRWRKEKGKISCAVVGSSDNMIGSNYGSLIDSHDVVIRMNVIPTKGYEKDVGTKTTFQTLYIGIKKAYISPNKILIIPASRAALDFARLSPSLFSVNQSEVYLIHPDLYRDTKHKWLQWLKTSQKRLSSGITVLIFAVHVCNEVNVFGFGLNKAGEYKHYY